MHYRMNNVYIPTTRLLEPIDFIKFEVVSNHTGLFLKK